MKERNHSSRRRFKMLPNQRQKVKITRRMLIVMSALAFSLISGGLFIYFNFSQNQQTHAAAAGDYRTIASGNWSTVAIWEKYDGAAWQPATVTPNYTAGVITLQSPYVVSVTVNVNVDQLTVDAGAQLNINNAAMVVSDGSGVDITVNGTVTISNTFIVNAGATYNLSGTATHTAGTFTISNGATMYILNGGVHTYSGGTESNKGWVVKNGGTYVHNVDGIVIPTATWESSSTLKITGVISTNVSGTYQDFGNVIYDCPNQTCCSGGGSGPTLEFTNDLKSIAGDFTVISTGTGSTWIQRNSTTTPVTIGGNYFQSGGIINMAKGAAFTINLMGNFTLTGGTFVQAERYSAPTLNIYGNFNLVGGTFDHSQYKSNTAGEGVGTVNLYGNYIRTNGVQTESSTGTGYGIFNFVKTGLQTFKYTGGSITNTVNFTVASGSITDLSTYFITGDGTFTLQSGGGLILASPNGITASAASGNVQVTGTRTYSTGGDYTFNATSAQVTGNGLPATAHNLTFDNLSGVTLSGSSTATNILALTNGIVWTGSYELGISNPAVTSIVGYSASNYVVGYLRRYINSSGSYDFPLGTAAYYEPATLAFGGQSGISSILSTFKNQNPINPAHPLVMVHTNGSLLTDMLDYGFWTLTPNAPMSGGKYTVTLSEKGASNMDDNPQVYCVLKRPDVNSDWVSEGTHNNNTQSISNGAVTAARSELTAFSDFGIAKSSYGPLPIRLMYFTAKLQNGVVALDWATAAEINNQLFTIEKSLDGSHFEVLLTKPGAGNSTVNLYYHAKDDHPSNGYSYYRLKQTDYNGHYSYSNIETVRNGTVASGMDPMKIISVSPNPFVSDFKLVFKLTNPAIVDFTLMNSAGQVISAEKIHAEDGINTFEFTDHFNLRKGIYYLTLSYEDQKITQKIIKN